MEIKQNVKLSEQIPEIYNQLHGKNDSFTGRNVKGEDVQVWVDDETEEVIVRTFLENDHVQNVSYNKNGSQTGTSFGINDEA